MREAVQRLAKGVQRQRLHVVLQIGVRQIRAAAREGAKLRGGHAQGPVRRSRYSIPMRSLPRRLADMVLSVGQPWTL